MTPDTRTKGIHGKVTNVISAVMVREFHWAHVIKTCWKLVYRHACWTNHKLCLFWAPGAPRALHLSCRWLLSGSLNIDFVRSCLKSNVWLTSSDVTDATQPFYCTDVRKRSYIKIVRSTVKSGSLVAVDTECVNICKPVTKTNGSKYIMHKWNSRVSESLMILPADNKNGKDWMQIGE